MKPYLLDGPLMTTIERRQAVVMRMARDLAGCGEALMSDRDAVRVLMARGYPNLDVAILASEARMLAYQEIVAKEMGGAVRPNEYRCMRMWKPDICIYHGGCDDGFGAAWAIWKRWGNSLAYEPGVYGKPLPDVAGKNVLFVDFSAKRPVIDAMAQVAKSIVIIDHHKTAEADLEPFKIGLCGGAKLVPENLDGMFRDMAELDRPPVLAWFDMEQSGAVMTWKFVYPDALIPKFLRFIEDRDLWRFTFGGDETRQFSAALRTYPMDFKTWDKLMIETDELVEDGKAILRSHNANIKKFMDDAYMDKIDGHLVPVVNVPYHYASDMAHALLTRFPGSPFTACWFRRGDGMIQYSLRSEDSRMDVSEIAKKFGGGGHRNAAGYQIASNGEASAPAG